MTRRFECACADKRHRDQGAHDRDYSTYLVRCRSIEASVMLRRAGVHYEVTGHIGNVRRQTVWTWLWAAKIVDLHVSFEMRHQLLVYGAKVAEQAEAVSAALRLGGWEAALVLVETS